MSDDSLSVLRRIGPGLRPRSDEIERARRLPHDVVEELIAAGAFKLWVPESLGGGAVSVPDGLGAVSELATHDGATGWCVAIAITTSVLAGYLPDEHAETIYGPADAVTGGFATPVGRARPVEGGLRVDGDWSWGSGSGHCTFVGGGTLIVDGDGTPMARQDGLRAPFVFFDPADLVFDDNWQVAGLGGTGSVDYHARDVLVPEGRWAQVGLDAPTRPSPITAFSQFGLLAAGVAATSLGIARRAVDEAIELASLAVPQGSRRVLADRPSTQATIADVGARLASARAWFDDVVGSAWDAALSGSPDPVHAVDLRLAAVHAAQTSASVAADCFELGGGSAIHASSALQRCWRDAAVASHHAMVAPRVRELVGRIRLGLETSRAQL